MTFTLDNTVATANFDDEEKLRIKRGLIKALGKALDDSKEVVEQLELAKLIWVMIERDGKDWSES